MLTPPLDGERQRPSHEPGQNATVNIMNEEKLRHFLYSLAWGILMRETSYSEDREEQRAADVFEELGLAVHVYNEEFECNEAFLSDRGIELFRLVFKENPNSNTCTRSGLGHEDAPPTPGAEASPTA